MQSKCVLDISLIHCCFNERTHSHIAAIRITATRYSCSFAGATLNVGVLNWTNFHCSVCGGMCGATCFPKARQKNVSLPGE